MKRLTAAERMTALLTAQGHFQAGLAVLAQTGAVDAATLDSITAASVAVLERELEAIWDALPPAARRRIAGE